MDEDLETEDMNPELAALSVNYPELAGKSASEMQRAFLPMYLGAVESERAAREKSATALKERYKAAEEAIKQQRFGAPTTSQQLAALSQALLAPRRMRGFAGTLANVMPAITEPAELRAAAETKRTEALRQLREQYATAADTSAVAGSAAKREALGKVLPSLMTAAGTTNRARFAVEVNPTTGVETYKNFAVPVAAVNALLYALEAPNASEDQKLATIKAFEAQFKVPASTFTEGFR